MKVERLKRGNHGLIRLWLNDEVPRIGSGVRWVHVRVRNHVVKLTAGKKTQIIDRNLFDHLHEAAVRRGLRDARNG